MQRDNECNASDSDNECNASDNMRGDNTSDNMEATTCESVEGADMKKQTMRNLRRSVTPANETATGKSSRSAKRM